jgi:hypothetical protein
MSSGWDDRLSTDPSGFLRSASMYCGFGLEISLVLDLFNVYGLGRVGQKFSFF